MEIREMKNKNTITINKVFSIENENTPQYIIKMSDGIHWSCARIECHWDAMPVEFCSATMSIRFINKRFKNIEGSTFEELETNIFNFCNKEVA